MSAVPALALVSIARARFMPVIGDSMMPTLNPTHMVAVVPVSRYRGAGLYVLDVLGDGHAQIARCDAATGRMILVGYDNPAYGDNGKAWAVCEAWFNEALIGQVAAVLEITDRTLLEDGAGGGQ